MCIVHYSSKVINTVIDRAWCHGQYLQVNNDELESSLCSQLVASIIRPWRFSCVWTKTGPFSCKRSRDTLSITAWRETSIGGGLPPKRNADQQPVASSAYITVWSRSRADCRLIRSTGVWNLSTPRLSYSHEILYVRVVSIVSTCTRALMQRRSEGQPHWVDSFGAVCTTYATRYRKIHGGSNCPYLIGVKNAQELRGETL